VRTYTQRVKASEGFDPAELIHTDASPLRGFRREVKLLARALTWTVAYYSFPTSADRYRVAYELWLHGVTPPAQPEDFGLADGQDGPGR
jgi:hypothetical protein